MALGHPLGTTGTYSLHSYTLYKNNSLRDIGIASMPCWTAQRKLNYWMINIHAFDLDLSLSHFTSLQLNALITENVSMCYLVSYQFWLMGLCFTEKMLCVN